MRRKPTPAPETTASQECSYSVRGDPESHIAIEVDRQVVLQVTGPVAKIVWARYYAYQATDRLRADSFLHGLALGASIHAAGAALNVAPPYETAHEDGGLILADHDEPEDD